MQRSIENIEAANAQQILGVVARSIRSESDPTRTHSSLLPFTVKLAVPAVGIAQRIGLLVLVAFNLIWRSVSELIAAMPDCKS
jgi:hypothetical protein